MTDAIDQAIDWRGEAVSCAACPHRDLLAGGECRPLHACVHDRYARRIDRFFSWNPGLANAYLTHPHFEVRAIAAKSADIFRLPPLLSDPEETVRWNAVLRLPARYLLRLRADPHREVRIRVAARLDVTELPAMMADADYYVRLIVARRIEARHLIRMVNDDEPQVRAAVARRIPPAWLLLLAADADPAVRLTAVQRLPAARLGDLPPDPDWRVRHEIAGRIDTADLAAFAGDPDPLVADLVQRRRQGLAAQEHAG